MNKYILADMITERLKREIGMVAKPLPEEIKTLEKVVEPAGRLRYECTLYRAKKLKKISIIRRRRGEIGAGTVVMIIGDDEYDLPFVLADIAFDIGERGKMFVEFEAMPLIKDEESTRKYIDPFRKWREAISKIPSEPVTGLGEPGEIWTSNLSPTEYLRFIHDSHTDEVLKFTEEFFNIFLNIYREAEPVKDIQRRGRMDAFRSEFNKYILDDDPSGVMIVEAFGRQTAELFYDYLLYL